MANGIRAGDCEIGRFLRILIRTGREFSHSNSLTLCPIPNDMPTLTALKSPRRPLPGFVSGLIWLPALSIAACIRSTHVSQVGSFIGRPASTAIILPSLSVKAMGVLQDAYKRNAETYCCCLTFHPNVRCLSLRSTIVANALSAASPGAVRRPSCP